MNSRDSQPGEPRPRRRVQEQQQQHAITVGDVQGQSALQSKSPRRAGHTGLHKDTRASRMAKQGVQGNHDANEVTCGEAHVAIAAGGGGLEEELLSKESGPQVALDSSSQASAHSQQILARYSVEELLALRDSSLVQPPARFSPYTPLRPGSQIKLPEISHGFGDGRSTPGGGGAYIGLEHLARAPKDTITTQQRATSGNTAMAAAGARNSAPGQRMFGGSRGSVVAAPGIGAGPSSGTMLGDGSSAGEGRSVLPYGSRNNSVSMGTGIARASHGRAGSNTVAAQAGARHANSNDRLEAMSWRSSGQARTGTSTSVGHGAQAMSYHGEDSGQPEWMADELLYDESQSARRMQDIEEWKRRMKEGGAGNGMGHSYGGAGNGMGHTLGDQQAFGLGSDDGAARGSRFLRMFSESDAMGGMQHGVAAGGAYGNGFGQAGDGAYPQAQSDDQLSKLFKMFGDKVSVGGGLPAEEERQAQAFGARIAEEEKQAQAFGASITANGDVGLTGGVAAAAAGGQRAKSGSPAAINEALRGIVPTSVFRKSVQSGGAPGGPKRGENAGPNRAATPARNLPSWLVELSRGSSSSPLAEQEAAAAAGGASQLGTHDLVDTLEREFPALNGKPRGGDNHSASSLSVQASAGVGSLSPSAASLNPSVVSLNPSVPSLHPSLAASPEAVQMQMQHGMLGMAAAPVQQHMIFPDGTVMPGMVGAPMGMVPMGFHPGLMYGMMPPPPPPPPGMFGGGGLHGPGSEHQQMMLMKMMMQQDMMFGQMGAAPPHMYSAAMAYPGAGPGHGPGPGMAAPMPTLTDAGMASSGVAPHPHPHPHPHPQFQQHQHQHQHQQ